MVIVNKEIFMQRNSKTLKKIYFLIQKYYFPLIIIAFFAYSAIVIYKTSYVLYGIRFFSLSDDEMTGMRYAYNLAHGYGLLFNPHAQPVEGITNVLVDGTNCIISGYNAPATQIAQAAPDLARILASFSTAEAIPRQVVRETSEGAYTLQIPSGWQWQASINRNNLGGAATTPFTIAREPQGMVRVMNPTLSWMYTIPVMGHFSLFPGGSPVLPLMTAAQFIQQVIVPQARQQYRDFKLMNVIDRPDFAQWAKWKDADPYGTLDYSVAVMEVAYVENSARLHAKSKVTIMHAPGYQQWIALLDVTYRAPDSEFTAWEPILQGVMASQQFDPRWMANEQRQSQASYNASQENIQHSLRNIAQIRQETSNIFNRSALNQIAAQDKNFEAFDDVINGNQAMSTSSGQVYKVPVGYDRYWLDGLGTVHGGSWLSQPNSNWQELKPTG